MVKNRALHGGRDDYFTSLAYADLCVSWLLPLIPHNAPIIEPAAGNGEFLRALERAGRNCAWAGDLHPASAGIEQTDFFQVDGLPMNCVVLTNPPFGHACSLAVRFFNHAGALGASTIAFIVPRTFQKSSIQNRLDPHYRLILDEVGPRNAFYLPQDKTPYHVPTCFQVWERGKLARVPTIGSTTSAFFEFVKFKDNWQFAVKRAGGRAGQLIPPNGSMDPDSDYFIRAKHGHKDAVEKALKTVDFSVERDKTAGTRSVSKRELVASLEALLN